MMWRREEPIFHNARDTLKEAVTEANGRTRCLKIYADDAPGSNTAR